MGTTSSASSERDITRHLLATKDDPLEEDSPSREGGFRTIPFIIVNESFEKVGSNGIAANMILYMLNDYHMEVGDATTILLMWSATSSGLALVGAFLSDSYFGRFSVISFGSFSTLLGMALLWLTAMNPQLKPPPCPPLSSSCPSATLAQLIFFLSSLMLISIGAGCIRPCSMAFGVDQLGNKKINNLNNIIKIQRFINWYYTSIGVSAILAMTVVIYIQDQYGWKVGFGVPGILMLLSILMFFSGSSLYVKVNPEKSLFTGFFQVPVAAFRNRNLAFSPCDSAYYHSRNSSLTAPSTKLRYLNKACIIIDPQQDITPHGHASNPWKLCTIEQVEFLKSVLRVIPICSSGIFILLTMSQRSFSIIQANSMDRHLTPTIQIPAGSFTVFTYITITVYVVLYDRILAPILAKHTGNPRGLGTELRMGIGLLLSVLSTALCAITEGVRRRTAADEGQDESVAVTSMSAMWLIPQYSLFGLAEAMNAIGQIEFYYSQFPKSMYSMGVALYTLSAAASNLVGAVLVRTVDTVTGNGGKVSWLSGNINRGHLDYYYWLLTVMGVVNLGYYFLCCWAYGPMDGLPHDDEMVESEESHQRESEHC